MTTTECLERLLLGMAFANEETVDMLNEQGFTGIHRDILEAMSWLRRAGKRVDHLTVSEELKARGRLAEIGGPAYLVSLPDGKLPGL